MKRILMAVYSNINTDARVKRSYNYLQSLNFQTRLLSLGNKKISKSNFLIDQQLTKQSLILLYFAIIKHIIKYKPDIFYAHDYYLLPPLLFIRFFYKKMIIYDSHELIIDRQNISFRSKLFSAAEYCLLKNNKRIKIISTNEERARIMKHIYKLNDMPTIIDNVSRLKRPPKEYKKDDSIFRFVYHGAITKDRMLDFFINTISFLDNIEIFIIGSGPHKEKLQTEVVNKKITGVYFLKPINHNDLSKELSKYDAGIVAYDNIILNQKYCAPNKIYEYLSLGIPVITTNQKYFYSFFNKYKIGKVVLNCDMKYSIEIISNEIKSFITDYNYYKTEALKFSNYFNWESEIVKLEEVVNG